MNEYQVYPSDGGWHWKLVEAREGEEPANVVNSGDVVAEGGPFDEWKAAVADARDHRGDVREDIYRRFEDGFEKVGVLVKERGPERVAIVREDGSLYGECDAALPDGPGQPIVTNISPVKVGNGAGSVD